MYKLEGLKFKNVQPIAHTFSALTPDLTSKENEKKNNESRHDSCIYITLNSRCQFGTVSNVRSCAVKPQSFVQRRRITLRFLIYLERSTRL